MKKSPKKISLRNVLKSAKGDSDFVVFYEQEKAINDIARMVRDARHKLGLTQAELAKRAGTTQSVLARLESGADSRTPSLDLLGRIAKAFKSKLTLQFEAEV